MDNLQALNDQLAELRGHLLAMECVINAVVQRLPPEARLVVQALHATEVEGYARALAEAPVAKPTLDAFERQTARAKRQLDSRDAQLAGHDTPTD